MLKIEKICVGYGRFEVLHEVSMEVGDNETAVVVGPNGAGKSTMLKVIAGALKPASGAIYFDGQRLDDKAPHEVVQMGISIVPEGGRLFPALTVYENLKIASYSKRARKQFKERVQDIFQLFPILEERKSQRAGSLSGGERQMLSIARALIPNPKLVMLDEPSSGLGPKIVADVFNFIAQIRSQGYSILMVEQNARKALELADYAYLLDSGRLKFQAGKEDFMANPLIKKAYLGI